MASKTKLNDALKLVEEKYKVKLREFQQATYQKLFNGKDVFVCAPTGSGKTFCFVFLSELQRLVDGFKNPVVLVISPLSGLMVDQAKRCQDLGLQASFIGQLQEDVDMKAGKRGMRADIRDPKESRHWRTYLTKTLVYKSEKNSEQSLQYTVGGTLKLASTLAKYGCPSSSQKAN